MILRVAALLALLAVAPAKKAKMGGSLKCEKGLFPNSKKDTAIPLCDEHYPDENSKHPWLVLFYKHKDQIDLDEKVNKIAVDLGNHPPDAASKGAKKKEKDRLKFLADKYDFKNELKLPKKGLTGTDAVLKVGAVCCDCATVPEKCADHDGLYLVQAGKETSVGNDISDIGASMKSIFDKLGYLKGSKSTEL
eukprot:gnl/TRDRNA2_/TRDRNA2_191918_c0_seq1.p1 gnl/TRDRNA2_/TRDRNA2_191918_c0~~gnl/TRDRNA2_/TRDRNA2_191918_c0_seq1.p1  ORF type:complete len:192 (+),score=60.38 gnl/TRDRNA2_/TRDRNA2_191918_c0_seq1:65-640(+)